MTVTERAGGVAGARVTVIGPAGRDRAAGRTGGEDEVTVLGQARWPGTVGAGTTPLVTGPASALQVVLRVDRATTATA